jgi:ribosomal protein S20
MPIIKSAKKRVKVAAKANARNAHTKRDVRRALKAFAAAVESKKPAEIAKAQQAAVSALDVAAKKDVIHKNRAARQKAQLSARAKAVVRQSSPSKTGAKVQKATAKKPAAKKPATKKAPAKKPAAKKTAPKK